MKRLLIILLSAALALGGGAAGAANARVGGGHGSTVGADVVRPSVPLVSDKAGVASSRFLVADPGRLTRIGASWSYDWSAQAPASDPHLAWVPMVWGTGSVTPATLTALRADALDGRARYLLGFNEPDNPGQSNMTPSQAAALWPALEHTGLILGSPAPASLGDGWLSQFMSLAARRRLRVDFIALHFYQDFTNPDAVAQLRAQLIAIHRTYRRPLWITEIGALNTTSWGEPMTHAPTTARAVAYMRRVIPMLDALPFVQRYAWFTDDCWNDLACRTSSLYDGAGRLTALGRTYGELVGRVASKSS